MGLIPKGEAELTPSELSGSSSEVGCVPHLSQLHLDKVIDRVASFLQPLRLRPISSSALTVEMETLYIISELCKMSKWACVSTPVSPGPGCPFCFRVDAGAPQRSS